MRPYVQGTDASALLGVRLEIAKSEGRFYTAYPNLAHVRWLLPANQPTLRRAGIEGLYQPSSLRGRALLSRSILPYISNSNKPPLAHDDARPLQVRANGVRAKILPR